METEKIFIDALVNKIQTTIDGGCRITIDVGMEAQPIVSRLMENKMNGEDLVKVAFVEVK